MEGYSWPMPQLWPTLSHWRERAGLVVQLLAHANRKAKCTATSARFAQGLVQPNGTIFAHYWRRLLATTA